MKKRILLLGLLTLSSLILIYCLHKICLEQNLKVGNFDRHLVNVEFKKVEEIILPIEVYSFAGFSENSVFLTSKKLNEIVKYNFKTKKSIIKKINHKNHNSNILGDSLFSFDPYFRKMYIYDANTLKFESETNLNVGFDRAIAVTKDIVLLRSATEKYSKTILSAFNVKTKSNSKLKIQLKDSLEVDGGLKTDGFFVSDNSSIIYTQYKKGNFYKINKALDEIKNFSTIDNIQNVEGVKMSSDSSYYYEKPVLNANLLTSISKDKFYVVSFVKGNSDKLSEFTKYRILDVYNLKTGKYIESFYIPNKGTEKTSDFNVIDNKIYLLFNNSIMVYEFNK